MKPPDEGTDRSGAADESEGEFLEQELVHAEDLEALYEAKLRAFEIPEIQASTNRPLKAKLRRAANLAEVKEICRRIIAEGRTDGTQD